MSLDLIFLVLILSGLGGLVLGYAFRLLVTLGQRDSLETTVRQKLFDAKEKAAAIVRDAEKRAEEVEVTRAAPIREREDKVERMSTRLLKREEFLDEREGNLSVREAQALRVREEAEQVLTERNLELARIAHLTEDEARTRLMRDIETTYEDALLARIQKLETQGRKQLEERARAILISTIHRLANPVNAEVTTLTFSIAGEDLKGKIIGREGRNIKAFERATGVDVLIDEGPEIITLSSFDPLRRQVAKRALERLIEDGRIQPTRIEDAVQKARSDIDALTRQKGEEAAYDVGVVGLDPKLITLLGRLHFRSSYGQNVLTHSVEMAHIAGMLATELGANADVARTGALLHDIGKAVDHEVQGTHVEIGRRILEKYGVDKAVIQAMQSHHEEFEYETPESILVQVADSISAGRPGARRDTIERYLDRIGELERIAQGFKGVEKAYAIQAGREIRIFVNPGKVPDLEMHTLAQKIALRVQEELKYPGEIKVNVIRENRVVEFAR